MLAHWTRLSFYKLSLRTMASYPSIVTSPEPSLFDEPINIQIQGLQPSKIITVYATTPVTKDCFYESFANYKASDEGIVDFAKDKALHGSYSGVEPMGLLWAMTPFAETQRKSVRFLKIDVTKPQVYWLQVFDSEIKSLDECRCTKPSKSVASKLLNRWFLKSGVRRISVRDNGIVATLFLPAGDGPFPGIINLFGGYPGVLEYKSALHASHGFASLALAYIGAENLPMSIFEQLDLKYFENAVNFMKTNENVMSEHGIGIVAICKGAQLALAMATYLNDIRCVVSVNGHCVSSVGGLKYEDKVWDDQGINYSRIIPGVDNDLASYAELPEPGTLEYNSAFFPFHKRTHVSYMFVAGLSDTCTPSFYFSNEMERLLNKEHHPDFKVLKYKDTGHLIEPPNFPFCKSYFQPGEPINSYLTNGGERISHCQAQLDCWPKILSFLRSRLKSSPVKSFL